ncbi:hypothetical protein Tco_0098996, partial [Tanacetum coccineum]
SPVLWEEIGESSLIGPKLVLDMTDKLVFIKEKLKAARHLQKSYADNRRKPLEFEVGDRVMLKVSPWKGVIRFGKKGKLALSLHVPLDEIKVEKTLCFVEEPVENSDCEVKSFLLESFGKLSKDRMSTPTQCCDMGSDGYAYPVYDMFGIVDPNMQNEARSIPLLLIGVMNCFGELNGAKIEQSG